MSTTQRTVRTIIGALLGVAIIIGIAIAIALALRHHHGTPTAQDSPSSIAYGSAIPQPSNTDTGTPTPSASASVALSHLSGDNLAKAWLHGYLDRTNPTDTAAWQQAIAPYTWDQGDPNLADALADPADQVKIDGWKQWKIASMTRVHTAQEKPTTPVRQSSAWKVIITDPTHPAGRKVERTYTITSYLNGDLWTVTRADQQYFSIG